MSQWICHNITRPTICVPNEHICHTGWICYKGTTMSWIGMHVDCWWLALSPTHVEIRCHMWFHMWHNVYVQCICHKVYVTMYMSQCICHNMTQCICHNRHVTMHLLPCICHNVYVTIDISQCICHNMSQCIYHNRYVTIDMSQ